MMNKIMFEDSYVDTVVVVGVDPDFHFEYIKTTSVDFKKDWFWYHLWW